MADALIPPPSGTTDPEVQRRRQLREVKRQTADTGGYTNTGLDEQRLDEGDGTEAYEAPPPARRRRQPRQEARKDVTAQPQEDITDTTSQASDTASERQSDEGAAQGPGSATEYARSYREDKARRKEAEAAQAQQQAVVRAQMQRQGAVQGEEKLPTNRLKAMFRSSVMRDRAAQSAGRGVVTASRIIGQAVLAGLRALLMNPWVLGAILIISIIGVVLFLVISGMTAQLANSQTESATQTEVQNPGAVRFQDPTSKL